MPLFVCALRFLTHDLKFEFNYVMNGNLKSPHAVLSLFWTLSFFKKISPLKVRILKSEIASERARERETLLSRIHLVLAESLCNLAIANCG